MSIPHRRANPDNVAAGEGTFFVTASTWGKRGFLQSERAAQLFIHTLYDDCARGKYHLHEFVVMSDHSHVLITIDCDMTIEHAVQLIKGGF